MTSPDYVQDDAATAPNAIADPDDEMIAGWIDLRDSETSKALALRSTSAVPLSRYYDDPPADYSAALLAALAEGKSVYLEHGDYPVSIEKVVEADESANISITGPGVLIQSEGKSVLTITAEPAGPWSVSSMGLLLWRNKERASDISVPETVRIIVLDDPDDYGQFSAGDKLLLQSEEKYAGAYVTGSPANTYKGGWADIIGFAVRINNPSSTIAPRSILSGSGGAGGIIAAVTLDSDGNTWVVLDHTDAPFVIGSNMLIGGTVVGTAATTGRLVSARLMDDTTYSNDSDMQVWRANRNVRVNIDVAIQAEPSPEGDIGKDDRKWAVVLKGLVDMKVDVDIRSAFKAAVVMESCYGGNVNVRGGNLPNITSEEAFGYGVMALGSTELTNVHVDLENVRHAFTTNCDASSDPWPTLPQQVLKRIGTSKQLTVGGRGRNTTAAAFDTHAGAWKIHFKSAEAISTHPAGKDDAVPIGFQNRGFGTIYTDCTAIDCEIGFLDHAYRWAAERDNTIMHTRSSALGFRHIGFLHGTSNVVAESPLGTTTYVLESPLMAAAPNAFTTQYEQISFCLGMAATTIVHATSRQPAHADIQIRPRTNGQSQPTLDPGIPELTIIGGFVSDHQLDPPANPTADTAYLIDAAVGVVGTRRMAIDSLTFVDNATGDSRKSLFHARAGVELRVRRPAVSTGRFQVIKNSGTTVPLSDAATGGSLNWADITTI